MFGLRSARRVLSTCKGAIFRRYGDPSSVLEVATLESGSPKSGEVKVKILAASVNPSDLNIIQGQYPVHVEFPAVAGTEAVAVVEESADASLSKGDIVVPAGPRFGGSWRQWATVDSGSVIKIGDGSSEVASVAAKSPELLAGVSVNPPTASLLLSEFQDLSEGDTVILNAGASSVALSLAQIAEKRGIRTVHVLRDGPLYESNVEKLRQVSTSAVVCGESYFRSAAFDSLVSDLPSPKLALNAVGGSSCAELSRSVTTGGTVVTYGALGGIKENAVVSPASSVIFNNVSNRGFWLIAFARENPQRYAELVRASAKMIAAGEMSQSVEKRSFENFWVDAWPAVVDPLRARKQVFIMHE